MAGFSNETMYADNVNFSGAKSPAVTLDGQLMIGSTIAPNIRIAALASSDSSLTVTNGSGTISLTVTGGSTVGKTITGDTGGARPPTGGNWNLFGTGSITTVGSGSTVTSQLTGLTNHSVLVGAGTPTITPITVGTTGQLLVGATAADPAFASIANADFTFGGANSGATRTLSVTNTSNTASSAANLQITTGGATAADPQTTYTVTGATSWSTGIDNSASDAYVIAASTALGTTNVISMATGGAVSVVLGNLDVTRSASGADVSVTASNTSNTASSNATHYATVAGTSAGDAQVQYAVAGTTTWTEGIDNSVTGDPYVLAASSALGTTNVMVAQTTGEITYPLQPAFLAYLPSTVVNVTGTGTLFQLGTTTALTEVFDVNGDFNPNGTFTAPVTGKYTFHTQVILVGCTLAVAMSLNIITSNATFSYQFVRGGTATSIGFNCSCLADMDAADTAVVNFSAIGEGSDQDDLYGQAPPYFSFFNGHLTT